MANTTSYSNLKGTSASFNQMLRRFGVVTVMNAHVYEALDSDTYSQLNSATLLSKFIDENGNLREEEVTINATVKSKYLCKLDTLKIANVTVEGPSKTVTGGQYTNPLIKYGKTARLEMQDALGNADALEALTGAVVEHFTEAAETKHNGEDTNTDVLHFGSDFCGERLIIGDSFFIDQKSGSQVKVKILFYRFLPDSTFNLTQDAEGDATVFDMNGDLLTTDILVGNSEWDQELHGVFYSILPAKGIDELGTIVNND